MRSRQPAILSGFASSCQAPLRPRPCVANRPERPNCPNFRQTVAQAQQPRIRHAGVVSVSRTGRKKLFRTAIYESGDRCPDPLRMQAGPGRTIHETCPVALSCAEKDFSNFPGRDVAFPALAIDPAQICAVRNWFGPEPKRRIWVRPAARARGNRAEKAPLS